MTGERIAALEGIGEMPREAPGKSGEAAKVEAGKESDEPVAQQKEHEPLAPEREKAAGMDLGL